jgi:hypothetical protein
MKRTAALAAIALIVIAGTQLVSAVGARDGQPLARRVSKLERTVDTLKHQLRQLHWVAVRASCLRPQGLIGWGEDTYGGELKSGYLFRQPDGTTTTRYALRDTNRAGPNYPGVLPVAAIVPQCLKGEGQWVTGPQRPLPK